MYTKTQQFLTVKKTADILQVSVLTIYEYIKAGKLKALKLGRNYRVATDDFNNFIQKNSI